MMELYLLYFHLLLFYFVSLQYYSIFLSYIAICGMTVDSSGHIIFFIMFIVLFVSCLLSTEKVRNKMSQNNNSRKLKLSKRNIQSFRGQYAVSSMWSHASFANAGIQKQIKREMIAHCKLHLTSYSYLASSKQCHGCHSCATWIEVVSVEDFL